MMMEEFKRNIFLDKQKNEELSPQPRVAFSFPKLFVPLKFIEFHNFEFEPSKGH